MKAQPRHIEGKTIKKLALNPFPNGRGGQLFAPVITLEDGSTLRFTVQEGESCYGVRIDRSVPPDMPRRR